MADPLIGSVPEPLRKAYDAAEMVLIAADNVVIQIAEDSANILPEALGCLQAYLPEEETAVRAVEADLAAARDFAPFAAMGSTYTTAFLAAVDFGARIASAVNSNEFYCEDEWGEAGVLPWAEEVKKRLCKSGVITVEGEAIRPGPQWATFRERFRKLLPAAKTGELLTEMRLEIAAVVKAMATKATAPTAHQPSLRLLLDDATLTITLDGTPFHNQDPKTYGIFKAIATASPNIVTQRDIRLVVKGVNGEKAISDRLASLHQKLRECYDSSTAGYWLRLPPLKKKSARRR
jgi:hypothetical protein